MEQSVPVRPRRKKKIKWIVFARACAILVVVMCHSMQNIWTFTMDAVNEMDLLTRISGFVLFTIGRISVPLFLMIAGYLLLDRDYDEAGCKRFWRHNWLPMYLSCALWIVIYHAFMIFSRGQEFNIGRVISEVLMLEGTSMSHMWYVPMVVGLYILIPFVAMALRAFSPKMLVFPLLIYIIYCFGVPTFNNVRLSLYIPILPINLSEGFSGGMYGIYLVMGYVVKKGAFKRMPTLVVRLIELLSYGGIVGHFILAYHLGHYAYSLWIDHLLMLTGCVATFECMSRMRRIPFYRLMSKLGKYSFGIFLTHNLFLDILGPAMAQLPMHNLLILLVLSVSVLILSMFLSFLISLIPKVGKAILLMK